jgi:hypothetical protein
MSKQTVNLATIDTTIVALTAHDMNHIRGGMATTDAEKAKRIKTGGVRNGQDKDWKDDKVKKDKVIVP